MLRPFPLAVLGPGPGEVRQLALVDADTLVDRDGAGGLYIGSDPLADIVLDDPAAEAWHARIVGTGHELYVDVIAGCVRVAGMDYLAGERRLLATAPLEIGALRIEHTWQPRPGLPTTRVLPRTRVPDVLAATSTRLLVRVVDPSRRTEVLDLGAATRLRDGIVVGSHLTCDVHIVGAGVHPRQLRLRDAPPLCAEVLAGTVVLPDSHGPGGDTRGPGSFELAPLPWQRWRRLRVGGWEIELCRWPARGEPVLRSRPCSPEVMHELFPREATRPTGPARPLPPGINAKRCVAALLACIKARPLRPSRPQERSGLRCADGAVAPVLQAWSEHAASTIRIGDLRLSDADRGASLPTFIKGEMYGEVEADYRNPRTDLLVIGNLGSGVYLAFRHEQHGEISGSPIEVDLRRGSETSGGSLGSLLLDALTRAWSRGQTTDLDPYLGGDGAPPSNEAPPVSSRS